MVMFEVYVLKGGVDSEVDVGFIVIELHLEWTPLFLQTQTARN